MREEIRETGDAAAMFLWKLLVDIVVIGAIVGFTIWIFATGI